MLSKSDIDKLAELCRLGLTDEEKASLEKDLSAILGSVAELEKVPGTFSDQLIDSHQSHNVMRADAEPHAARIYTEAILAQAPKRQGDYFVVKAILEK